MEKITSIRKDYIEAKDYKYLFTGMAFVLLALSALTYFLMTS